MNIETKLVWLCFFLHVNICLLHVLCCWWHSLASITDGRECARKDLPALDIVAFALFSPLLFRVNDELIFNYLAHPFIHSKICVGIFLVLLAMHPTYGKGLCILDFFLCG